jgi:hypothetical protein
MSSVTSCVGGGLFICFTCWHTRFSTDTNFTCMPSSSQADELQLLAAHQPCYATLAPWQAPEALNIDSTRPSRLYKNISAHLEYQGVCGPSPGQALH